MTYNYENLFVKIFGNLPDFMKISLTVGEMKETIKKAVEVQLDTTQNTKNEIKTFEISVEERKARYEALKKILPLPLNIKKAYKKEYKKNLGNGDYKYMLYGLIELGVKDIDSLKNILITHEGAKGLKNCKWLDIPYRLDLLTQLTKNL